MGRVCRVTAADVFVSWLPLYHDMGLIGAWLGSLYHGCRLVVMPPLSFSRPPGALAPDHRPLSRHALRLAEFRLRALLFPARRRPAGRTRPQFLASGLQRRRAGHPGDPSPLPEPFSAATAFGPRRWPRSTAWPNRRWGCSFRPGRAAVSRPGAAPGDIRRRPARLSRPQDTAKPRWSSSAAAGLLAGTSGTGGRRSGPGAARTPGGPPAVQGAVGHQRLFPQPGGDGRLFAASG